MYYTILPAPNRTSPLHDSTQRTRISSPSIEVDHTATLSVPSAEIQDKTGTVIARPVEKSEIAVAPLTAGAASVEYELHADW